MANDITLAVGDGARRMTHAELAAVQGIIRGDIPLTNRALETAIDSLREQLQVANSSILHERGRADQAEQRIDELQVALACERLRVLELLTRLTRPRWLEWWRR